MEPNHATGDAAPEALPAFASQAPDFLRRDTLMFVCEEVRVRGWLFEHVRHATLEHRIFDDAGNELGRVTEQPPAGTSTLLENGPPPGTVRAAVYDSKGAKIVEFAGSEGNRKLLGRELDWGRRLEVADGAGRPVGTLETSEFRRKGTITSSSGERIGAIRAQGRSWNSLVDFAIEDSRGTEVGWLADPSAHARRLARVGRAREDAAVAPGGLGRLRHFLAISGDVTPDLRLMMVAASAGVHLALSGFSQPGE